MVTKAKLEQINRELNVEVTELTRQVLQEQDRVIAAQRAAKENLVRWQKAQDDVTIYGDLINMHEKDIAKLKEKINKQADRITELFEEKSDLIYKSKELEETRDALQHAIDVIYNNQV